MEELKIRMKGLHLGATWGWILVAALAVPAISLGCLGSGSAPLAGGPIPAAITLPPAWTPSPAPALNLPDGWHPLFGMGVELWLPESFEGGDPATRREELLENMRALGPGYENLVAALEAGAPGLVFFAFDQGLAGATVGVTRRDLPASVGMDEYLETYVLEIPGVVPGLVVLGHGTMTLQGEEVGKVQMDIITQETTSSQVSFMIHRGDTLYTVSYAVPSEFFPEAEPAFEASIVSFRVTQ